jgi:hypothetical protein
MGVRWQVYIALSAFYESVERLAIIKTFGDITSRDM